MSGRGPAVPVDSSIAPDAVCVICSQRRHSASEFRLCVQRVFRGRRKELERHFVPFEQGDRQGEQIALDRWL